MIKNTLLVYLILLLFSCKKEEAKFDKSKYDDCGNPLAGNSIGTAYSVGPESASIYFYIYEENFKFASERKPIKISFDNTYIFLRYNDFYSKTYGAPGEYGCPTKTPYYALSPGEYLNWTAECDTFKFQGTVYHPDCVKGKYCYFVEIK
jgi:hypothetical protein